MDRAGFGWDVDSKRDGGMKVVFYSAGIERKKGERDGGRDIGCFNVSFYAHELNFCLNMDTKREGLKSRCPDLKK